MGGSLENGPSGSIDRIPPARLRFVPGTGSDALLLHWLQELWNSGFDILMSL